MRIPGPVKDLLAATAPTLLRALNLPPPLNAIAAHVASGALKRLSGRSDRADPLSPSETVAVIRQKAGDPHIFARLQEAEAALQRYEQQQGIRFAELANADRARASGMLSGDPELARSVMRHGMRMVYLAMFAVLLIVGGALMLGLTPLGGEIPSTEYTVAAFGIVGTAVGFISGIASSVVTFYFGSSQGSQEKTRAMEESIRSFGDQLTEERKLNRRLPAPEPAPRERDSADPATRPEPADPASHGLLGEILERLVAPHRHFEDAVSWALSLGGVCVEGAPGERTPGKPETARRIWSEHGAHCAAAAKEFGVPVELIVATIATETKGDASARRSEPRLGTESVGLMQTLVTTAQEMLGRMTLTGDDLLDPALSIRAGAAFIARQRKSTHFDPPLVAAAYNAGSLRRAEPAANRWCLKSTGDHIDRFAAWFGDAMTVAAEEDWGAGGKVPSFAAALAAPRAPAAAARRGLPPAPLLAALEQEVALDAIEADRALCLEVQARLSAFGYLDPPADGAFRDISRWSLAAFCRANGVEEGASLTPGLARLLAADDRALPALPPCAEMPWLDRVAAYMERRGHWIARAPECRNILYLEGTDPDGTLNDDAPNRFNDLRVLFWTDGEGATRAKAWEGTTEPSRHWTERPMNARGAARIAFGQYRAWQVGTHREGKPNAHEALIQTRDLPVYRDLDQNYVRKGDRLHTGVFGINQHSGYDLDPNDLGRSSAGCLVGRTKAGHAEFMAELKRDPRYLANPRYTFLTTVLHGRDALGRRAREA